MSNSKAISPMNQRSLSISTLLAVVVITVLVVETAVAGPEIPGAPQKKPIALVGGIVFPVSGKPIENGTVLFEDGKITAVGAKVKLPKDVQKIDVQGKHVYPGLIDASTTIGLVEIGAVRATDDESEVGEINPNVRAIAAVNPDSEIIPTSRSNGILVALTQPGGPLIQGMSGVITLDGWTPEEMALLPVAGLNIRWPSMQVRRGRSAENSEEQKEHRNEQLEKIESAFDDARAYWKAVKAAVEADSPPPPKDFRWDAMIPVLEGKTPIIVRAERLGEIESAVAFAAEQNVKLIILGGYDAVHCAPLLKEHKVPVILGGVHRLPLRRHEPYDTPFTVAEQLRKAGVPFCIASDGSNWNSRNLPYHAGTAAAFGLPPEAALAAITQHAANILGVGDRVGTIEPGKDATLIVTSGDILETPSVVEMAFVSGRKVDLSDRHKKLRDKYEQKYKQ